MMVRLGDRAAQSAANAIVGREPELAQLCDVLRDDGPPIAFVHGMGGIGKTTLLVAFAESARRAGATVMTLDGRSIEPSAAGFLHELGLAAGAELTSIEGAVERLRSLGRLVVVVIDTYEVLRLLDTWLRQEFVPALPETVRIVFAGRHPPALAWYLPPGWDRLVARVRLEPLADDDSLALLQLLGLGAEAASSVNRFARGHPLALRLAASSATERRQPLVQHARDVDQTVLDELARLYFEDIHDELTRAALEAAAMVRRTTASLLAAMLPHCAPQDALDRLRALPFVEAASDGLHLHEAVQESIAGMLHSSDPERYLAMRRAAAERLQAEVKKAGRAELWRYTADLLFLLTNPVIRDAFFPPSPQSYTAEPATSADEEAVRAIATRWDGDQGAATLMSWFALSPALFRVLRDPGGEVAGYSIVFDRERLPGENPIPDAVVQAWLAHLRLQPVRAAERVLFCRRWLSREAGERPSPEQAASWLDLKRNYMEMRPALRRVYCTVEDPGPYAGALEQLGFELLPGQVQIGDRSYRSAVLDFGPDSVEGWLVRRLDAELAMQTQALLDERSHEIEVRGQRLHLTPLEFAVMRALYRERGRPVHRQDLLAEAWGYEFDGGSNVVETVVRSLRRKLGDSDHRQIETVRGVGYRLREP